MPAMTIVQHYRKLYHYARHRYEGNKYEEMRNYFAQVLVEDLEHDFGLSLNGLDVLEVGGHTGRFSAFFSQSRDARCVNVEIEDMQHAPGVFSGTLRGDGTSLPVRSASVDFVLCRGVIEHVPHDQQLSMLRECSRALKPGGHCLLNTQPWFSPFAGHQLRPFHMLPLPLAIRMSNLLKGTKIHGDSLGVLDPPLHPVTMRRLDALVRDAGFQVVATKDYHFRIHAVTKIPLLREVLTQSITYMLRTPAP
jgi:arabinofuranan 3-O-arabinosyltransferase